MLFRSMPVSIEACDHIVESVAVDIVSEHVGTPRAKRNRFVIPKGLLGVAPWIFKPPGIHDDVRTLISVDITDPQRMPEAFMSDRIGDAGECPRFKILSLGLRIAEHTSSRTNKLWESIPVDIGEGWRFVGDPIEDLMLGPMTVGANGLARVLVHISGRPGEAYREDIVVTVPVEVVDPREEVIGVGIHRLRLGWIDLVRGLKRRAFEPVRSIDHIRMTIPIKVSNSRTFAEVSLGESLPFEGVNDP